MNHKILIHTLKLILSSIVTSCAVCCTWMSPPNNNKENGITRVVSRKYTLEVVTYKKTISALCVSTLLEPCEKWVFKYMVYWFNILMKTQTIKCSCINIQLATPIIVFSILALYHNKLVTLQVIYNIYIWKTQSMTLKTVLKSKSSIQLVRSSLWYYDVHLVDSN